MSVTGGTLTDTSTLFVGSAGILLQSGTGRLIVGGSLSEVLLRFASQFVGRFRGGLGHTNILTITFFSGSENEVSRRGPTGSG